jgi:TMEM175 potassium channel family protein
MHKGRLEAFSDGVIAILITIMVLELHVPHGADLAALQPVLPHLLSYALSFVFLGIYWNNHHHMLQAAHHVDGRILWANMHLLFWLSLVPFGTAWLGEHYLAPLPVAMYGAILLFAGCAYYVLSRLLIARHGADSPLARAVGSDVKGLASLAIYALAIAVAFSVPQLSCALYVVVAIVWLVPDRRIERVLEH